MPNFKYTKDHECVYVEGDIVWIGITPFAQNALGDLVFVDLPAIGKKVGAGESAAVVESVKTAAEVYTPIAGEVVAVNDNMPGDLELIKSPVNEKGWIVKLKVSDKNALNALMDEAAYKTYLESLD
jgi:glycine cleavage system H protein